MHNLKKTIWAAILLTTACSTSSPNLLTSDSGQLFCSIQTSGGGAIAVGLATVAATSASPTAGPIAVVATNATKDFVDGKCKEAAAVLLAKIAVPIPPPAVPVPIIVLPVTSTAAVVKS